jgi:hypothetical protein
MKSHYTVATLVLLVGAQAFAADVDDIAATLREKWTKREAQTLNTSASYHKTVQDNLGNKQKSYSCKCIKIHNCFLIEEDEIMGEMIPERQAQSSGRSTLPASTVQGVNSKYIFSLDKADVGSGWRLKNTIVLDDIALLQPLVNTFLSVRTLPILPQSYQDILQIQPLHELFGKKSVKISVERGNSIILKYDIADSHGPGSTQSGWYELHGDTLGIKYAESTIARSGYSMKYVLNAQTRNVNGLAVLEGYDVSFIEHVGGKIRRNQTEILADIKYGKISSDEHPFTLSQYGLPEPEGILWKKPIPLYVWLLAGAAVLGLIALVCRWLLRRRLKSAPVAPPPAA